MTDTAKLKERLRIDDVIARLQNAASGIHLHDTESAEVAARDGAQALSVLVAAIERLEAERDEERKERLARQKDMGRWMKLAEESVEEVARLRAERDEAVGLLETVTSKFERGGGHMQDYQRARAFLAEHEEDTATTAGTPTEGS